MYGDVLFAAPCEQTIKAMAKTTDTPIYHYLYAHPGITEVELWIFSWSSFKKDHGVTDTAIYLNLYAHLLK